VRAADWPQWRGPARNAQSDEQLSSKDWASNPPKHLWTVEGFEEGYASVSIVSGILYSWEMLTAVRQSLPRMPILALLPGKKF